MLEGLFVFGGLAYLASSLTDRFGINYAYAGLMVAGFGCGGLIYSVSVKKLVGADRRAGRAAARRHAARRRVRRRSA